MPDADAVRKDAELVVDVCMSVEADDVVTIITDDEHVDQARVVAEVCVDRGAWPVIANNEMQVRRGSRRHAFPDGAAAQPPPGDGELGRDHHHHQPGVGQPLRARLRRQGVLREQREDRLGRAGHGRVGAHRGEAAPRAAAGVGRDGRAGGRREGARDDRPRHRLHRHDPRPAALEVTSIKKRGQMMGPLPLWAEVAFAAVEDETVGTVVVDGVMLGIGLPGQVTEPITWTVEGGKAVKIEGGDDARRLREVLEGVENATVIGEFAFGVSEVAPFGTPSEKGRVGTVHLALGDNHNAYPGGQNVSSLHLDGVMLEASMQIVDNGRWILQDGKWVL